MSLPTIGTIKCQLCPNTESRAGDFKCLEDMGWQLLVGHRWICPKCGGRNGMAASFWDPAKWSAPEGPITLPRDKP